MIARLVAQRRALAAAAAALADVPGDVIELGLGKGRTYAHLLGLFPGRTIWALDRDLHVPKGEAAPPPERFLRGDFRITLPGFAARHRGRAALIHADIGTREGGRPGEGDAALAAFIAALAPSLLAPGGLVLADRAMPGLAAEALALAPPPDGIAPWPYFAYRAA
jgi:hypothetical protein